MLKLSLRTILLTLFFFGLGAFASAQTSAENILSPETIAANKELDRKLIEGHELLDADKVMALFTKSPEIFFITPDGTLARGPEEVRQTWTRFFASLDSIHGEINHIKYLKAGDGVVAVGQVTYTRQLKGGKPQTKIVVWTDFRRFEDGKWVYAYRHAHWPL